MKVPVRGVIPNILDFEAPLTIQPDEGLLDVLTSAGKAREGCNLPVRPPELEVLRFGGVDDDRLLGNLREGYVSLGHEKDAFVHTCYTTHMVRAKQLEASNGWLCISRFVVAEMSIL